MRVLQVNSMVNIVVGECSQHPEVEAVWCVLYLEK